MALGTEAELASDALRPSLELDVLLLDGLPLLAYALLAACHAGLPLREECLCCLQSWSSLRVWCGVPEGRLFDIGGDFLLLLALPPVFFELLPLLIGDALQLEGLHF